MQTHEVNLKRMLPPAMSPRHPITVGSPTMCRWFTDAQCALLMTHLAEARYKAELQVTFGRCGKQRCIPSCCDSILHGTETHTVFVGVHEKSFVPVYMREQTLAVALGQATKYMQRGKTKQQRTQALVILIEDSMMCNRLRDWYQRGAWRFETGAGEAISN